MSVESSADKLSADGDSQDWRRHDPGYARELSRYGRPVPSRAYILDYLKGRGKTLSWKALCKAWQLDDEQAEALARRLKAMERDGEIIRNRKQGYGVVTRMDLVRGRIIGHPDGYGFLKRDDGGEDLYISPRQMRAVLHGDRVVMRLGGVDRRGRREGSLVEVLERNTVHIAGRFFLESGIGFVVPDNRRINQDILIPPEYQDGARHGEIVAAELIEQPSQRNHAIARITKVLGAHMAPGMEVEIAIVSHDIPFQFPAAVKDELCRWGDDVPQNAIKGRTDFRRLPLVTIDGVDARDFDDAVYCEQRGDNWRLLVAIADVSWYVGIGGALDIEARRRGTSVYFPNRVIPMLPEVLSNGLCSLKPDVDRLCLVCDLSIDGKGRIIRSRFVEGVMRSHARLTYDAVADILLKRERGVRKHYRDLVPHLENLHALYRVLSKAREQRGGIDFDSQETAIEFGADGKIEAIVARERNDAHRLIEECMIAANIAAARFLRRHRLPGLYRVHDGPGADKLEQLRGFLGRLGLSLGGGDDPSAKDCAVLLDKARKRADFQLLQTVVLRSLSQAVYSPDNSGHFGLALETYAHFTSPIRRYPDLLLHRAIRHRLRGGNADNFAYTHADMLNEGEHASMTERRADEATRDTVEWLKCHYMSDKVNEVFDGIVSGVTAFGLFVSLNEIFVEGLVHVTALPNDYYHYDPLGYSLRGRRTGRTYRLGDSLQVKLVRVDLDERKIDFELPSVSERRRPRKQK